jgi:ABC-type histidine transport system ATPase subunit
MQRILAKRDETDFAREVSSKVIFLQQGRVEEEGAPEQVFSTPASQPRRQFISSHLEA